MKYILVLFLCTTACTTVYVNPPLPQTLTPRLSGNEHISVGFRTEPALNIQSDGMNSRPPNITTQLKSDEKVRTNATGEVAYSKSFWEASIAIYPGGRFIDMGGWLQGKLQLLGPNGLVTSESWFFTPYVRIGSHSSSQSGDQKVVFGGGGYPWTGKSSANTLLGGLSIGKSFAGLMIYIGGAYQDLKVSVSSEQAKADDNSDPGGSYSSSFVGYSSSGGIGLEYSFDNTTTLGVSAQYISYDYNGARDTITPVSFYFRY